MSYQLGYALSTGLLAITSLVFFVCLIFVTYKNEKLENKYERLKGAQKAENQALAGCLFGPAMSLTFFNDGPSEKLAAFLLMKAKVLAEKGLIANEQFNAMTWMVSLYGWGIASDEFKEEAYNWWLEKLRVTMPEGLPPDTDCYDNFIILSGM